MKKMENFCWLDVKKHEPDIGEIVDIYTDYGGRYLDYEYEGNGMFYNNNLDDTKEVNNTEYAVTHFIRIPNPIN